MAGSGVEMAQFRDAATIRPVSLPNKLSLFVPCPAGVEPLLEAELKRFLPPGVRSKVEALRGGCGLIGMPEDVLRINLESRLAQRVLVEIMEGPYRHDDDLYALARRVDWRDWLTPQHTLRVDVTAQRSPLKSLNFAALRIKDAICDQLREHTGERPSVDTHRPDLPVVLHVGPERAALYVDTSGEPLFKRGWRIDKGDAPLKETLAAAMLAAADWRGTPEQGGALHDPCCGSGTIPIEAALIACDSAPGLQGRSGSATYARIARGDNSGFAQDPHIVGGIMLGLGIIGWIIIGGLAGWIASKFMGTDAQQGIVLNVVAGVVGGLVGGFLLGALGVDVEGGGLFFSFLTCLAGACIVIFGMKALTGRK